MMLSSLLLVILTASLVQVHARPQNHTTLITDHDSTSTEIITTSTTSVPTTTKTYRLGSKPGGLRLIEAGEGTRIIFLFDFKPVPLFRREGLRLPRPKVTTPAPPTDNLLADSNIEQRDESR